jgi:Fibronectin type III domain
LSRRSVHARAFVAGLVTAVLLASSPAPHVLAQTAPDRSDVVLVLDFSASILDDPANRNRFAAALERIADRVDETSSDLVAGDATASIVQFAAKAADYEGCTDIKLLDDPDAVARFADCLRSVAGEYRTGLDPALTREIGIDTNYVAAMERAVTHLPLDAVRPALILLTDGKHDVSGVPVSEVEPARDRLFGDRSPFALLPVGMGLDPQQLDALEGGLTGLRIIRDMPPCVGGTVFDWPEVVFESPDEAGNAVAVALQDATCTFTVAAAPTPIPTATPAPAVVQGIRLVPGDGSIDLSWSTPAATSATVVDHRIRCRAGDGDWIEAQDGVSPETTATVEGLTNGTAYQCEVAAVGPDSTGAWTAAPATATPLGRPAAPQKPAVEPLDGALRISVVGDDEASVSEYRYECSGDNGVTWVSDVEVGSSDPAARVADLENGVGYVCRAFAMNAVGRSDASPLSDAVSPCGSLLECNALLPPIMGVLGIVLTVGLLAAFVALYRERRRGYVVAVVDVVHIANLGHGSRLGLGFVREPGTREVTGIVADRSRNAEIRIRQLRGGRFEVKDKSSRHVTMSGEPIVAIDSRGGRHQLILRAFATKAASPISD